MGDIHVKENKKDCCSIYMYLYIHIYKFTNAIVRLPHPRRGESQGQETFKPPSLPINSKVKGIEP